MMPCDVQTSVCVYFSVVCDWSGGGGAGGEVLHGAGEEREVRRQDAVNHVCQVYSLHL